MNQPQLKRRRLLSNSLVPLLTPNLLAASLKPSKISTCTSCHRTIGLKSSPPLVCARCSASTCAICVRTCTGDPLPMPSSRGNRYSQPLTPSVALGQSKRRLTLTSTTCP
ncbi:hypothetical protein EDB83DRAFT_694177 [Lactarius deliciosus]|nr:hypothetical protein EDB83DRAFT_694177 [Lactarius deliciosus]